MSGDRVRAALRDVSDGELLAAIRRGSVALVLRVLDGCTYWERDGALRSEAVRRGIL